MSHVLSQGLGPRAQRQLSQWLAARVALSLWVTGRKPASGAERARSPGPQGALQVGCSSAGKRPGPGKESQLGGGWRGQGQSKWEERKHGWRRGMFDLPLATSALPWPPATATCQSSWGSALECPPFPKHGSQPDLHADVRPVPQLPPHLELSHPPLQAAGAV